MAPGQTEAQVVQENCTMRLFSSCFRLIRFLEIVKSFFLFFVCYAETTEYKRTHPTQPLAALHRYCNNRLTTQDSRKIIMNMFPDINLYHMNVIDYRIYTRSSPFLRTIDPYMEITKATLSS